MLFVFWELEFTTKNAELTCEMIVVDFRSCGTIVKCQSDNAQTFVLVFDSISDIGLKCLVNLRTRNEFKSKKYHCTYTVTRIVRPDQFNEGYMDSLEWSLLNDFGCECY